MSQVKGGVILARALKSMGVDTIFFLVGGPMQEIIWECHRLGMKLIDVRHEQAAAMMAHAYSRVTGKVGICITASGVATANTVTGLAVASDDCAPVLAIGGSVTITSHGTGSFEEMDQVALMKPVTKRAWQIETAERITDFVDMAFRSMISGKPGPVYLDCPADVLDNAIDEDKCKLPNPPTNINRPSGDDKSVQKAITILERAERPVIIAGSGVVWSEAGAELTEFVERTQIPFFTTPLARGLVPEDHPLCFPGARSFAWKSADVVLVIGTRANWIVQHLSSPRFSSDAKLIFVNIDAEEIGHNRPADVGIVGDAKAVLRQLTEQVSNNFTHIPASKSTWVEKLKSVNDEREEKVLPLLNSDEKPIHPLRLCKEIRDFLQRDAILVVDGNEILNFARQSIPSYYPRHRLNPGPSGCIGTGIPFGIGAKVAAPEKQVLILTGDGSFGMNGMEMDTAIRRNINVVVVVSHNGGWSGLPSLWPTGRDLGFTHYEKIVEALGGFGSYVEEPQNIRPALESAFASGKPALINVIVSPAKAATQPFASLKMGAAI